MYAMSFVYDGVAESYFSICTQTNKNLQQSSLSSKECVSAILSKRLLRFFQTQH